MNKRKIVLIYIFFGVLWVLGTDYLVGNFVSVEFFITFQKFKGLFFVAVTALAIYILLNKKEELNSTKEQEQKLTTLINSMVDFVIFKDGKGNWLEANEFGLKLLQLEDVDYRGKTDIELSEYTSFYKESLHSCALSDEETWERKNITRTEEIIPLPDGSNKYFDTMKVPLFYENGNRKGLVIIGRDVTDTKIAEERLRKSEKLSIVGELAASVGHEIRNPLTSIKGFLQLLEKKDKDNTLYFEIMLQELDRINHIVSELLLLAKPQKVEHTTFDIGSTLKDVVYFMQTEATMKNVQIHFSIEKEHIITGEKNQLKQVFINVIKNAIEASLEKENVWIKINQSNDNNVAITIKDEGPGIPQEFLTRLGEPFYSSKEKGTGLGLTVSHKIVEQHGGTISYYSSEKKGTKVEISLPIKCKKSLAC
ncbi:ATP-binding protein [Evansella sp. AB-rgal1]|uniref:ATP-binding protein n=1 Tax=Evansella sp. AB-rgal1 TaxID=3242696 RepID=UPI00359D3C2B